MREIGMTCRENEEERSVLCFFFFVSQVTLAEVEESFDRLMVGNRRTGVVMKEEERRLTAYHEVGD